MTCRASLSAKVASQLIQFLVLDWVMEDGGSVSNIQGVKIEPQRIFIDTTTRSLVFDSLNITHEASYKCEAKLILPDFESFNTSMLYHLNVLSAYSTYMYVYSTSIHVTPLCMQYCLSHRQEYCSAEVQSNGPLF